MRGLQIDQSNLTNQQGVVKNEVRVNVLNAPYGGFPWLDMPQYANKNWYNAHNFYGDLADLDSAKLEDVADFFKTFYSPNNAVLVVSGDFEVPAARQMVDKYFSKIPAAQLPAPPDLTEPKQTTEQRFVKEDKLARKPGNLSFEQSAVVPVSAGTALQALCDHGQVAPGQRVLINGASGGVGSYAVQIAKAIGAEVTAVASTAKLDLVHSLGADHVMDYTRDDFADGSQRYDLILDIGGNPSVRRLRRALTPAGTAVIVGGEKGGSWTGSMDRPLRALALSPFVRQRLTNFIAKQRASDLDRITELIEGGLVTPHIDSTYRLDQVPEAIRHLQAGKARGKIAIAVPPPGGAPW